MHRCMCIWQYILQNYNYKLHFQNLSIYHIHISHVFIETLAVENLDVCTACDWWDSNIQLTMVKDRRWQIYPNVVQFSGFLGAHQGVFDPFALILITDPPGAGYAFPRQRHMRRGRGLFISARVFFPVWCYPWMDDGTNDGTDEKASWKTTTTSFIICNALQYEGVTLHKEQAEFYFIL